MFPPFDLTLREEHRDHLTELHILVNSQIPNEEERDKIQLMASEAGPHALQLSSLGAWQQGHGGLDTAASQ